MSARRDQARNRRALTQALATFEAHLSRSPVKPMPLLSRDAVPLALHSLAQPLGLSAFERDALLLAVASQLDSRIGPLLTRAQVELTGENDSRPWLTGRLALALFKESSWDSITPVAPLRSWHLIELVGGLGPLDARWAVDEAAVHHIAGAPFPDPRIEPWMPAVRLVSAKASDTAHDGAVDALGAAWEACASLADTPVARVSGPDGETVVQAIARRLGLSLHRMTELPPHGERDTLARLWAREALLRRGLLWLDTHTLDQRDAREFGTFIDALQSLTVMTGEGLPLRRAQHRMADAGLTSGRRLALWREALGERGAAALTGTLEPMAEQFQLTQGTVQRVAEQWQAAKGDARQLWEAARDEARQGLDGLAQRIDARATWADLILPEASLASLHTMTSQLRQRVRVHQDWGFADTSSRGLGISALFSGASGTGKTLAAEVLAHELSLDLYRIDLAALVSKYIGETEKNLARVFAAAEASGAILLFDEADALFGKRSEVKDSHDRYANIEVSYLLQRVETYRGLAILTTNLKQAIDPAFQRRIRFIVPFPFPDEAARAAIWQRAFPPAAPLSDIDFGKLMRLSLSGGHIRNLALNAAFLAADEGSAITMKHLRSAAESEFAKLERPLPPAEVGDWI
ncbi:ATP-binding protein [Paraburkholderia dipogonis]|uniref:ATP-binding protein n=1 Tax=Paraburkholderia dipogonis TaxID=1211383 RepID=UPI0038BB7334